MVVRPVFFVLATVCRILSANVRSCFVDSASIVSLQMLAIGVNHQIPIALIDEDRSSVMNHVPSDVFEIFPSFWRINSEREIAAALRTAVLTKIRVTGEIFASRFFGDFDDGHLLILAA